MDIKKRQSKNSKLLHYTMLFLSAVQHKDFPVPRTVCAAQQHVSSRQFLIQVPEPKISVENVRRALKKVSKSSLSVRY